MTTTEGFSIEISSQYEDWWRYNVAVMCGCFDADDNRIGFASTESHIADVGSNLKEKPEGTPDPRNIRLDTIACDHLMLYIYIVPHTLPGHKEIGDAKPFETRLCILHKGRELRSQTFNINQWSGTSIELKVQSEPAQ
ncbi:hypothetical protein [uncultured Alistipes sp.]|jgi:hypothetical protein|uniref:hypothetical protein n=1 Tax=uncultured Alistipes sp. TaxID=538949 RepID=UPI0025D1FD36|nr:hypothetical protein [uncultured Alistipes sp.]